MFLKRNKLQKVLNFNKILGRRHSKLFTNCHVSWDTLYINWSVRSAQYTTETGLPFIYKHRLRI